MHLHEVLRSLRRVAPEALAEDWDAAGLQVGRLDQAVTRLLLCIDLTEPVLAEAVDRGADLIVAYHPLIFQPVASLTDAEPRGRILLQAIERGIAVYSPHTALDSAAGGVNDFLADGLGAAERWPIRPTTVTAHPADQASESPSPNESTSPAQNGPDAVPNPAALAGAGQGRVIELDEPVEMTTLAERLKGCLGLSHVPVGLPDGGGVPVQRIGLCPGAGGSLMGEAGAIDAFLTGEMRHHDQLAAKAQGTALLLPGHSETERPYLPTYRDRLAEAGLGELELLVSQQDTAPLALW